MCNEYRSHVDIDRIVEGFSHLKIRIEFPDARPNLEPRDSIRITDTAPIVRANEEEGTVELVQRRWSWPSPKGAPVFNFRSENREFKSGRCLIITDGFYEFTPSAKGKKKDKWLFTLKGQDWFCIAGIWRQTKEVGEAFTMLTAEPGPDVAPYHDRQVVVLRPQDWSRWLDADLSAKAILKPLPAGSLNVEQIN